MVNMGIEPFLVGTAVNVIQAQRLVRRICTGCRTDVTDSVKASELLELGFTPEEIGSVRIHAGTGCDACRNTGFKGRVGLYEVMEMSDGLRDLVMVGATAVELQKKVRAGVTTLEEIRRETVGQGASR
jgi:type IV pilus assembly protein PilB